MTVRKSYLRMVLVHLQECAYTRFSGAKNAHVLRPGRCDQ